MPERNDDLYSPRAALRDAVDLLHEHFDQVDQKAAVDLATFLYSTEERTRFLREHPDEPGQVYP